MSGKAFEFKDATQVFSNITVPFTEAPVACIDKVVIDTVIERGVALDAQNSRYLDKHWF